MIPKLILASQSPRRKQLLEWADVAFEVKVSDSDESFPEGLSFEATAMHIAKNKALAVKNNQQSTNTILAADTIVICNNEIIGKPTGREDAINIIQKLSGKTHQVVTGVFICNAEKEISFAETTEVSFYELTEEQIVYYVEKYQPYDKAGAYAIQEWIGVIGIKEIKGDFYNVMGLPVSKVIQALNKF
jgi:septum formation protein